MNLYRLLQVRAKEGRPVRIGVIGAGKFSSMFLSQARLTPGMQLVGIADLDPDKARQACLRTGWAQNALAFGKSTAAIEDGAAQGKTVITDDARKLIEARLDVIVEITGVPEAGAQHAWQALEAGSHVVMVNVEADALLGPVLARKAEQSGLVYSTAYGDQPALIAEQIDWARAVGLEVVCAGKGTRYQPEFHYSTPETVWDWARAWAPRFPNLAAITFEYHESYHKRLGISGVARELDLMHDLAAQVAEARGA